MHNLEPAAGFQGDISIDVPQGGRRGAPPVSQSEAAATYTALQSQRREISNLLEDLVDQRSDISRTLSLSQQLNSVSRAGLEQQLTALDARITELNKTLAANDLELARVAAIPGAVPERVTTSPPRTEIIRESSEEVIFATGLGAALMFFTIVWYERRMMKRWGRLLASIPANLVERLGRVEEAIDEQQRDGRQLGSGAAPYFGGREGVRAGVEKESAEKRFPNDG